MALVGFEITISAGERPKTYALNRAATGTGTKRYYDGKIKTMRLAGYVECIGEVRNALSVSVWTYECKRLLAEPRRKWEDNT